MKRLIALILVVTMSLSFVTPVLGKGNNDVSVIESGVNLLNENSNKEFYSQEEWERIFPDGTFIFEYSEYTAFEGGDDPENKGDSYFGVNIIRMGGKNTRADVTFDVTAITAEEDDFEVNNDTLTFLPGEEMKTAYVKILDNNINQHERFLSISLMSATKGHIGQMSNAMICIKDDEEYIETEVSLKAQTKVDRNEGNALVTLSRSEKQSAYVFSVEVVTNELSAKAGEDYLTVEEAVAFGPGETEKTVIIPILQSDNDDVVDFEVELINPKGGTIEENSKKTKISVTNNGGDKTNPIHDTESMIAAIGDNDVTDDFVTSDKNLTDNLDNVKMNINQEMVDSSFLLRSASSAFSANAAIQPFSATDGFGTWKREETWGHTKVDLDPYWRTVETVGSNAGFKQFRDSSEFEDGVFSMSFQPKPTGLAGAYGGRRSIDFNLRHFKSINYYFKHEGGKTYHSKGFGEIWYRTINTSGTNVYTKYVLLEDEEHGNDERIRSGDIKSIELPSESFELSTSEAVYIEVGTRSADKQDTNHLTINPLKIVRESVELKKIMMDPEKVADGYKGVINDSTGKKEYEIKISIVDGEGGFGENSDKHITLFVGSKVKYTITPFAENSTDIATSIELRDSGEEFTYFKHTLGGSAYNNGSYTFTKTFETHEKIYDKSHLLSDGHNNYYSLFVNALAAKDITIDYNAASELIDKTKVDGFISLSDNSTTINKNGEKGKTYNFGINNFSKLNIDFPAIYESLGGAKKAEIDLYVEIAGKQVKYAFDASREVESIPFSSFANNKIRISLVDSSAVKTDSHVEFIDNYVNHQIPTTQDWTDPILLNPFVDSYDYETIHNPQKNPVTGMVDFKTHNNFISDVIVGNVYLKPINLKDEKYALSMYLVDQNGLNQLHLFDFEHDTRLETPQAAEITTPNTVIGVKNINKGIFGEASSIQPKIVMTSRDALTVTYRIMIPSSYNYEMPDEIRALFKGNHRLELQQFSGDLSDGHKGTNNVAKGKGIKIKLPDTSLNLEEQNAETESADGQENMRVYSNETTTFDLPELGFNLNDIIGFFTSASPVDIGGGLQLGGDEITVSFNIGGSVVSTDKSNKSGLQNGQDELKNISEKHKSDKGVNPTNQPGNTNTRAKSAGSAGNSSINVGGGFAVTIRYDSMKGAWEFSECSMYLSASGSYTAEIPFEPLPIVFLTFGIGGGMEVGTGFKSVPYKNVGGKIERKIVFSGISLSPSAYIAIGIGVGIPSLVSVAISGFVRVGITASFAKANVIENFGDYDIVTTDKTYNFSGAWVAEKDHSNAFKNTLLKGTSGSKFEFTLDAYKFDLTGKLASNGGKFNITLTDEYGKVIDKKTGIDTKNSSDFFGATLYKYRGQGAAKIKVLVEVTEGFVYFDALHFESSTELYEIETIPASFDAWNVKVGIEGTVKITIFSFSMELIYFLMNEEGLFWGYPLAKPQLIKKWEDLINKRKTASNNSEEHSAVELMPRNKELQTYSSKSIDDYFDFGKLSDSYERKTIDSVISGTTLNQIVYNNGHLYKFWIDDAGSQIRPDGLQRNALFYQIDDGEINIVEDDGTIDMEFTVSETIDGKVKVIWSSYDKNVAMLDSDDNIALLKHINSNIELKSAVINDDGTVSNINTIPSTTDGVNDFNLKATSNSGLELVAFTKDQKGAYDANIPIKTPEIDPGDRFNDKLAEFMNAQYRGIPQNYISVTDSEGNTKVQKVEIGIPDEFWKVGTMITSNDITFIDDKNVVMAFSVEIPSAQKEGRSGKNNLMFLQYGKVNSDTNEIIFEKALMINEIFNYDDDLDVVFPESIPNEYVRSDGSYFENPIIGQVMFKTNPKNNDTTLFYKSNAVINTIDQETLNSFIPENKNGNLRRVIAPIAVDSQEYDINYTTKGRLYMLYSESAENGYDNQLMIRYYDDSGYWTDGVQVSYGHAFDQEILDASGDTGRVAFEKLSSVIVEDESTQKLVILNQVSYAPFKYLKVINLENEEEDISYLDEADSNAIRSLSEFTITDVKNAIQGSEIKMSTNMFIDGNANSAEFSITNIGTNNIENFKVELRTESTLIVESPSLSVLIPGMEYSSTDFIASVTANSIMGIPFAITEDMFNNGDVIYYVLKNDSGIIYDSRDDNYTYTVDESRSELEFGESKLEWAYNDSKSELSYTGQINNIGHKALDEDVKVIFEAMTLNENSEMVIDETVGNKGVLGQVVLSKDLVNNQPSNMLYNLTGKIDMPLNITELSINVRMRIEYGVAHVSEYETFNNVTENKKVDAPVSIVTGFESKENILNLQVGDVIDFTNLKIISPISNLSLADLDIYEVDSDHLSINHSTSTPSIKVMSTADDLGVTQVRLAFNLKGTTIESTLHLNVDRSIILNLDGVDGKIRYGKWTRVVQDENYPLIGLHENDYIVNSNSDTLGSGRSECYLLFKISKAKRISLYAYENMNDSRVYMNVNGNRVDLNTSEWQHTLEGKPYFTFDIPEALQNDAEIAISVYVDDGNRAVLDYIKLDGAIDDLPPEEAFVTADESGYKLDAPIQNGRNRKAEVYFVMSEAVELKSGENKENLTTDIEVEKINEATKEKSTSTLTVPLDRISEDGKTLYFVINNIASEPGYVVNYSLKSSSIPNNKLVRKDTTKEINDVTIPNISSVKFSITESKIEKIEVVDNNEVSGKFAKDILVSFEKAPDVSRLTGTTILFNDVAKKNIEFKFVKMSDGNAKQAIYHADIVLDVDEMNNSYSFEKGIVLKDDYALISSDGNFIDGAIKSDTIAAFNFKRIAIAGAPTLERFIDTNSQLIGEKIVSNITFDKAVKLSSYKNDLAYIEVSQALYSASTNEVENNTIKLFASGISNSDKTIRFESKESMKYTNEDKVTYGLISSKIQYASNDSTKWIVDQSTGISADANIVNKPANVSFNPKASIQYATLKLDGGFKASAMKPFVEVVLNSDIYLPNVNGATIDIKELREFSDGTNDEVIRKLVFEKVEKIESKTYNDEDLFVATFVYPDDDISFSQNEENKQFELAINTPVVTKDGADFMNKDNNIVIASEILSVTNTENFNYTKVKVEDVTIERSDVTESTETGNIITVNVKYDGKVNITDLDSMLISLIKSEEGKDDVKLDAYATKFDEETNTVTFTVKDELYSAGKAVTYSLPADIDGSFGNVVDENSISVSTFIDGMAALTFDNDGAFSSNMIFNLSDISLEDPIPKLEITYPLAINEEDLIGTEILVSSDWFDAEGILIEEGKELALTFKELTNDGKTIVYSLSDVEGLPENWLSYTWKMIDTSIARNDSLEPVIKDKGNSILLDVTLPVIEAVTYTRPVAKSIKFSNNNTDMFSFNFKSLDLFVEFDKNILLDEADFNDIQINVDMNVKDKSGAITTEKVVFKAVDVIEGNAVVFSCATDKELVGALAINAKEVFGLEYLNQKGMFDADSPNMLVYEVLPSADIEIGVREVLIEDKPTKDKPAKTGEDNGALMAIILIMIVSLGALLVTGKKRKQ